MNIQTTLRNGSLGDLVEMLNTQADVKYDAVVPASRLRYQEGHLVLQGGAMRFDIDGVSEADALFDPTEVFEDGVSDRLQIPRAYLRRLRSTGVTFDVAETEASLLDANVNGWLKMLGDTRLLLRAFRTDDPDSVGIARALLSDRYAPLDDLDVTLAALAGVREAGLDPRSLRIGVDKSERNMRVRVVAPEITALAPTLLANYRSPFARSGHGQAGLRDEGLGTVRDAGGNDLPIVQAGLVIGNSETGGGAFHITPRIEVRICSNGMTYKVDALRQVHLGARLEDGVIRWSDQTKRTSLDLVTAKAKDAVKAFLSPEYVQKVVDEIEKVSATPLTDAVRTIERVAKQHAFSEEESKGILDFFIQSGDVTAGGVMQATTAYAQVVDNPDRAAELEDVAFDVLVTASRS